MSFVRAVGPLRRLAALAGLVAGAMSVAACGGALPRPAAAPVSADDYVAVPFSPRTPPVEFVPPSPAKGAVWVDGSWEWSGNRYVWRFGSWVVPPPGVRLARWVIVRRRADGQLFFAPSSWKDASGATVTDRSFIGALGPRARARSRLGAPPPVDTGGVRGRRAAPAGTDATVDTGDSGDEDD
ncbi:MAG: YXWGXW repeat-containing protein [Labilithrix sp.]|nr:YXWGXW repeat-containing protein [Labilithrix sp.]MCW5831242.1 YXWGXW repeat-containing protein [Labilithrix sp.]